MLYRIITEDKNRIGIIDLVGLYFDSKTIYPATGIYKGITENALIIEIDDVDDKKYGNEFAVAIKELVLSIKRLNKQECVLLQQIESDSVLI